MHLTNLLSLALSLASAEAVQKGFNYGAAKSDGSSMTESDFQAQFKTARNLDGTSGFSSARLYTMIQGGTPNQPISAIPAAIAEQTSLLLGLWASGGGMENEIAALKSAIDQYGDAFINLVVGISVGSEDLYRNSIDGEKVKAGVGIGPDELISYINKVRSVVAGTPMSKVPIGHVDTWTAWTNGSNAAVIDAIDWLGFDGYPYFQSTMTNSISDAKQLFEESVQKTKAVAKGKEVWITETGWPVSGPMENLGEASIKNAKQFWDEVGCSVFDNVNTWWYLLQDATPNSTPSPSFGLVGSQLTTKPLYDLTCPGNKKNSTSSSSDSSKTAAGSSAAATGSPSAPIGAGGSQGGNSGSSSAPIGAGGSQGGNSGALPPIGMGEFGNSPDYSSAFPGPSYTRPATSASSPANSGNNIGSGSISGSVYPSGSVSPAASSIGAPTPSITPSSGASSLSSSIFGAAVAIAVFVTAL